MFINININLFYLMLRIWVVGKFISPPLLFYYFLGMPLATFAPKGAAMFPALYLHAEKNSKKRNI
jgi:hypothetical protein